MKSCIVVFNQFVNGGCENLFISIAARCPKTKFYLIILKDMIDEKQLNKMTTNIVVVDCKFKKFSQRFLYFLKFLKRNLLEAKIMIDFHEVISSELFMFLNRNKKICWHWYNSNPLMKISINKKSAFIYFHLFQFYKKVIFICNTQKAILRKIIKKYPEEKCFVSYNFVDKKKIIRLSNENCPIKENYIVTVARIDFAAKDFGTLLKAYELLQDDLKKKYKLVIVGDGKDMNKLIELVKNSNSSEDIILAGNQNNPYPYIKNATVFVLSSYSEGFPISILEAFTLGIPVISSNCLAGPKEILGDGQYGKLFEVGNSKELSDEISEFLKNPSECEKFSQLGKKRAEFYSNSSTQSIQELFQSEVDY